MPEQSPKMPQNVSPPVRTGAGDISERELTRERYNINTTPTARVQPAHPKKILHSVPVNKFTARGHTPSHNLAKIKSCLDEYHSKGRPKTKITRMAHKAASMEDLTPNKRVLKKRKDTEKKLSVIRSPGVRAQEEEQAAAKIGRFMLLAAWRRRRQELRCLRKTLEVQVTSSERLRAQVWALKYLLDSDNNKVRLAMRELERLKQLLRDKDKEKGVLEKEQRALEADVCAAEDRASELSIGLRNCRNELEAALASAEEYQKALEQQKIAVAEVTTQRDLTLDQMAQLEAELLRREALLASAQSEICVLRCDSDERQKSLDWTVSRLKLEHEARLKAEGLCRTLAIRANRLRAAEAPLKAELRTCKQQLSVLQRRWLPTPLLRMLESARSLLIHRSSFQDVFIWSLLPARHGC